MTGPLPLLRRPRHQRGASLIEVLVAALLLAIGLLAMVGVQTSATRFNKDAQSRSTATELANGFAELARSNVAGVIAGGYTYNQAYAPQNAPIPMPNPTCNTAVACTAAQIAAVDMARWREAARQTLPGGSLFSTLTVPASAAQAPVLDLWVLWLGPESDDAADAATQQLNANCPAAMGNPNPRPQCMLFRIQL